MPAAIDRVCGRVLKRVMPTKQERSRVEALARKMERRVSSAAKAARIKAKIRVEGSVAKDTWLSGEPDIDIFMRMSLSVTRDSLGDICLGVARKATKGSKQVERYAEHPYLEAFVEKTRVNIVPCYDTKIGNWKSATDRTPFHSEYIKKQMSPSMPGEVRLLKKFMKGTGTYGAEIRTGGFSGYLCELLILQYGSFVKALVSLSRHTQRPIVDVARHYLNREHEITLLFKEPLVVVDPVDRGRNVASAVKKEVFDTFVAASQAFLRAPDLKFFYPPATTPLTSREVEHRLVGRGSALLFVALPATKSVPDVLWGQLYKSQRSLRKLVLLNDFRLLREATWSNEKNLNIFILELEQQTISPVKKHFGPPLAKENECWSFLKKHGNGARTVCGPYVEDGRWVVIIEREFSDAAALLRNRLSKDGGRNIGVAEELSHILKKSFRILVNKEIAEIYRKNHQFAKFLTLFLDGRPKWLECALKAHKRQGE